MKRAQYITLLCLLGSLLVAAQPAPGNGIGQGHPGECARSPSVSGLIDFVAEQTGYPPIEVLPDVRPASAEKLATVIGRPPAVRGEHVHTAYVPVSKEILVGPGFDLCTALDRSFLVHELVHVHQFESGAHRRAPCIGWLEGEAYRVQADYLKSVGLANDAFGFDLLGLLQSACAQFYNQ